MVKLPRPGRVKTRLGRGIGMVAAAWWYRHQVARLLRRLRDARWRIVLAVSPGPEAVGSRVWPAGFVQVDQGRGGLGARMARGLGLGAPGDVVLIGSDIPGVTRHHVARAFAGLGRGDLVFGPSEDGGFWCVGVRHGVVPRGLFAGARWSGPHALADCLANTAGRHVVVVDRLRDVDEAGDLG